MTIYLWICKIIGPVVLFLGTAGLYFHLDNQIPHPILSMTAMLIIGGILAIFGIILGFTGWAEDVAPRMFWVKSKVELLDNKFGYALSLGLMHFLLPAAIVLIASWCQ